MKVSKVTGARIVDGGRYIVPGIAGAETTKECRWKSEDA